MNASWTDFLAMLDHGSLDVYQPDAVLAGGTDLLVDLKQGKRRHEDLVSLTGIPELRSIGLDGDRLSIGAAATQARLISPTDSRNATAVARFAEQRLVR